MRRHNFILTSNNLISPNYCYNLNIEQYNFIIYFNRNDPLRGQDISTQDVIKLCRSFVYEI
jgi:hypothetical protein